MKSKQSAGPRSDRTLQEFVGGACRFRRRNQARSGSRLARLQLRLDQFAALLLLLLFAPLMAVIALLVWRRDGAPVLFGHYRIGQHGRPFRCLKFRSMYLDSEAMLRELLERDPAARAEWERDHKLTDDPRITPIGHFLRRTSLDELPQLFNVLRGEMSLVGPRPITLAELPRYGQVRWHYLSVRPGMTGLWQVSGRNDTTYDERVELDREFVEQHSLKLRISILLRTLRVVIRGSGAR
ncbi:undecaprenyl-phosphate galactosephosphotransferase [Sphaerotilus natans subsp. natans DSM 6575]|uniref:Undecaprenyl-phosphate galactosephosphotransferase n=1 Tax=Sphaerotilus natans subsp. natans DSM 6575 TaxID=1286631 RepID=A0A059KNP8_9BURK|nr:undecaprenyl-phosphate galactosephosphotransferase [Sphaerotilus natans subsp. natans DSM 6575]SIQ30834.1 Sugar transferase involved in LPS biosynthesis (colanic, teichoic acid) [Sphaerotilus natans]